MSKHYGWKAVIILWLGVLLLLGICGLLYTLISYGTRVLGVAPFWLLVAAAAFSYAAYAFGQKIEQSEGEES